MPERDERPVPLADRMVVVRSAFDAPPERVFDAWLDPTSAGRWLFATPDGQMQRVEIDARVGGSFTIVEKRGETLAEHFGTYVEIDRPSRLAFDFTTNKSATLTRVTVDITTVPGGCAVTLSHELDPAWVAYADRARAGWGGILDGLGATVQTG